MTLRARLTLGFLAIAVLLVIPLGISLLALRSVQEKTSRLQSGDFTASQVLGSAIRALAEVRAAETAYTVFPESESGPPLRAALDSLRGVTDSLATFGGELALEANRVRASLDTVQAALPEIRALADADELSRADTISELVVRPALAGVGVTLSRIGQRLEQRGQELAHDATEEAGRAYELATLAFIVTVLLAAATAILITRAISRPVRELDRGMQAVADGDFRRPLSIGRQRDDEFGRLARSYHEMTHRLAELDKLKAEFVSIASHELKTPINVILGYLQLLDEGLYGPMTPRQREVVATLSAQGQSLARLVQQLLDVSRFEAGGGRLDLRPIELPGFIADLESAFEVLSLQREVGFHVLVGEDLPTTVCWDGDRMNEVMGNLLSNAFKFTERGGRVDLEATRSGDGVRFVIRDTGAGIAASQLPHVFRKFYQADNQASAAAKGSGLGLAIAKEIVEAHGGSIGVDSTPGVGTAFILELPLQAPARRGTSPVVAAATAPGVTS